MGLGYQKSRRHAASDRRVKDKLALHVDWMKHFQAQGMDRSSASAAALQKVQQGDRPPTKKGN